MSIGCDLVWISATLSKMRFLTLQLRAQTTATVGRFHSLNSCREAAPLLKQYSHAWTPLFSNQQRFRSTSRKRPTPNPNNQPPWTTNTKNSSQSSWTTKSDSPAVTPDSLTKQETRKITKELKSALSHFGKSVQFRVKCKRLGLKDAVAQDGLSNFVRELFEDQLEYIQMEDMIMHFIESPKIDHVIFPAFSRFLMENYPSEVGGIAQLIDSSDMRAPALMYSTARSIKRKIVMHVGPTNSGKTHAALERFKEAKSAIYCGPLRLLAHEVYSRMNKSGVPCNLLTGEERRESDGIDKWSCTVEMALLNNKFDVAVVDEIQMIGDDQRGWAWTQALLGLQASEIHLCGEASAIDVVRRLCATTGDEVHINEYKRLTSLSVSTSSLESKFDKIEPGDAIVVFSRKAIFAVKRMIEKDTKYRAAVIYGSLPPESRAEQARLFNDPDSPFQVLVASDAIGMGLNLNIRRIVFFSMQKYNGEEMVPLTTSQTKQIAGRAGRFKTQWENGIVTTYDKKDMKQLHAQMRISVPKVMSAGLMPSFEQVQKFANAFPNDTLSSLLAKFEDIAQMGGNYFLCNLEVQREIANLLKDVPMSLRDKYCFLQSPCNMREPVIQQAMIEFARVHAEGTAVTLQDVVPMDALDNLMVDCDDPSPFMSADTLYELEAMHRMIILYLWLSIRFPGTFTEPEQAMAYKERCEQRINSALMNMMPKRLIRSRSRSSSSTLSTNLNAVRDKTSADVLLGRADPETVSAKSNDTDDEEYMKRLDALFSQCPDHDKDVVSTYNRRVPRLVHFVGRQSDEDDTISNAETQRDTKKQI